jgi:hypothetical protein
MQEGQIVIVGKALRRSRSGETTHLHADSAWACEASNHPSPSLRRRENQRDHRYRLLEQTSKSQILRRVSISAQDRSQSQRSRAVETLHDAVAGGGRLQCARKVAVKARAERTEDLSRIPSERTRRKRWVGGSVILILVLCLLSWSKAVFCLFLKEEEISGFENHGGWEVFGGFFESDESVAGRVGRAVDQAVDEAGFGRGEMRHGKH